MTFIKCLAGRRPSVVYHYPHLWVEGVLPRHSSTKSCHTREHMAESFARYHWEYFQLIYYILIVIYQQTLKLQEIVQGQKPGIK